MANPIAVLVDDDPQQLEEASSSIRSAGYAVTTLTTVEDALAFVDETDQLVDLFVLDRKLPMRPGDRPVDELGDGLFRLVSQAHPDARIIVFSGYTDFEHLQATVEGGGFVYQHGSVAIDRVSVLRKNQFDMFEGMLETLRNAIGQFERIEVSTNEALSPRYRRILQRVAHHHDASSITAEPLAGGLTGAPVWRCQLVTPAGPIADIVAKVGTGGATSGGLQDLLAKESIARRVDVIRGLMGGATVTLLQLAGASAISLMSLLGTNDIEAAKVTAALIDNLDSIDRGQARPVALADLVEQILPWSDLVTELAVLGLHAPKKDLWVTTSLVMSHTDLHASNVLVCDSAPVIIDSDDNAFASALRDPIVLLLSSWVHPDSPFVGVDWPSASDIESIDDSSFSRGSLAPAWYSTLAQWIENRTSSKREYWAVILAYSVRQLRFENVRNDEALGERVRAAARLAHRRLCEE